MPGEIFLTKQVLQAFKKNNDCFFEYINRHCLGDWGDAGNYQKIQLSEEDQKGRIEDTAKLNVWSLKNKKNSSILGIYALGDGTKIWIITTLDFCRNENCTTILLPAEY